MNITEKLKSPFQDSFSNDDQGNQYNYFVLGTVAAIGHIIYGYYWTYIDPQPYESLALRSIGFISCITLLIVALKEPKIRWILPATWIFAITYNLPFFFTANLIRNEFSDIWFVAQATMIFTVILFIPNLFWSLLSIFTGILLAIVFCLFTAPETVYFHTNIIRHLPVYLLTLVAGYVFSFSSTRGICMQRERKHQFQLETAQALAGSIAHEIRTPLSQVTYNLNKIDQYIAEQKGINGGNRSFNTTNEINNYTLNSRRAIQQGLKIIDFTLEEVKNDTIDRNTFSIYSAQEVTQYVIENYGYKNDNEVGKIKLSGDDFPFLGDETLYSFIIFNLIKNALYYLPVKPKMNVFISIESGSKNNTVRIKDTGPGIAEENIHKLFDSFYTSGKPRGTGLGLSYCKRVMQAFGGDITCKSTLGEYTEFTLTFPIISNQAKTADHLTFAKDAAEKLTESNNLTNKTLLIIDDEQINRTTVKDYLDETGLNFIEADNGITALEILKNKHCDLIITDLNMPGMTGITLAEKIRSETSFIAFPHHSSIPIIALSGDPLMGNEENCRRAGMNAFLHKPVEKAVLINSIVNLGEGNIEKMKDNKQSCEKTDNHNALYQLGSNFYHDMSTPLLIYETNINQLDQNLNKLVSWYKSSDNSSDAATEFIKQTPLVPAQCKNLSNNSRDKLKQFWGSFENSNNDVERYNLINNTINDFKKEWLTFLSFHKSQLQSTLPNLVTTYQQVYEVDASSKPLSPDHLDNLAKAEKNCLSISLEVQSILLQTQEELVNEPCLISNSIS